MTWSTPLVLLASACLLLPAGLALAQSAPRILDPVQVSASRPPHAGSGTPAAASVVEIAADHRRSGLGSGLAELLPAVPGVVARNRQNLAQDEQVSIRGFGARSTFGVRGLRLYVDGIPATMPDGQGQVSHFPLSGADRIEILRGPYSALYGNAAGGVIELHSARGDQDPGWRSGSAAGADDTRRASLGLRGHDGRLDYALALNHFETGGWRRHSRAQRRSGNARLGFEWSQTAELTVLANVLSAPRALDPLGLTRAQFESDPRQAGPAALLFDTRKSVEQQQLGLLQRWQLGASELRLLGYYGERQVEQYLAIPVATQANPLHGGGVIDLHSPYRGLDLRLVRRGRLGDIGWEWVLGSSLDRQDQRRRGYENFVGSQLGVRGALRRDQQDRVSNLDQYAELGLDFGPRWALLAGLRHGSVRFRSNDLYLTARNPDDSGNRAFEAWSPVLGLTWHASPALDLHASFGRAFETPTFDELGYRPDGSAGLNFALEPARTRNFELGARLARPDRLQAELVLFRAATRDELAVASNAGGRATFQNVDQARRSGVELAARLPLAGRWQVEASASWLDARYRSAFLTCTTIPCASPNVAVAAGTRIPGVPRSTAWLALQWGDPQGWFASLQGQHVGHVTVNNVASERAPGYAVFGASIGRGFEQGDVEGRAFLALHNLFDRRYSGSVIVNESNGRYYEPAPGRNLVLGMELRWRE